MGLCLGGSSEMLGRVAWRGPRGSAACASHVPRGALLRGELSSSQNQAVVY